MRGFFLFKKSMDMTAYSNKFYVDGKMKCCKEENFGQNNKAGSPIKKRGPNRNSARS